MFKKNKRLTWKDINFLVRKRQYFPTKFFWYFYYDQYRNLKLNQISVNIPLKYSKKAVIRNSLKRKIISFLQSENFQNKKIWIRYYKIFVNLNKKNIWELKSEIQRFDKRDANHYILEEFKKSFLFFLSKLWK